MNEFNGTFVDWHLKLWGESIDPDKATLLPLPTDNDDDSHDEIVVSTTTIAAATTSVEPVKSTTPLPVKPSDHPDRPVNSKPADTAPEPTGTTEDESDIAPVATTTTKPTATPSASKSNWLPSFFPTFGASSKTQVWIYGSVALILIFCSGLGVYFYMARRKRLRNNPRDEWEFDLLQEDEADGLDGGRGVGAKKGGKRRAGELYDAFATGSDGEEEGSSDDEEYRDGHDFEGEKHVIGDDEEEDEGLGMDEKQGQRLMQK